MYLNTSGIILAELAHEDTKYLDKELEKILECDSAEV
jgi:hypothetical protein